MRDGTKIDLGFQYEGITPTIKTGIDFTVKARLLHHDDKILRYIALYIIGRLDIQGVGDADNFICQDALNLNNTYGVPCANGHRITALYMGPYKQVMALVEAGDGETTYDVFIA